MEGLADGDDLSPAPGRVPGVRRRPVRDLHARDADGVGRAPRRPPRADRAPGPRRAWAASCAAAPAIARSSRPCAAPARSATADGASRRRPAPRVGARIARVDGVDQVTGATVFGADEVPADALTLRAVRSPHAHARFTIGDLSRLHAAYPGLVRVLTAADVPGANRYGIYADRQGPAGARRRLRPVRGRGRRGPRRRRRDRRAGSPIPTCRSRGSRCRTSSTWPWPPRRRAIRLHDGRPRQPARRRPGRPGRRRGGAGRLGRRGVRGVRDDPRRARLHRARGRLRPTDRRPDRRLRVAPRRRTWTATSWP